MSNDNKELKTKELCEEIKNLTEEDLDNVTGGASQKQFYVGEVLSVSAGIAYIDSTTSKLN